MNKPAIKNILANFAVHVAECHKKETEPNLNPWADLFTNKPITEEQVVSSENPDTGTTISTGGEMVYVQADWKDLYREELAEEKLKARQQAFKEVEAIGKRYKNAKYSTDQFVISGKKWDKLKKLMEVEK